MGWMKAQMFGWVRRMPCFSQDGLLTLITLPFSLGNLVLSPHCLWILPGFSSIQELVAYYQVGVGIVSAFILLLIHHCTLCRCII